MLKGSFAERQAHVREPVSEDRTSERASNERLLWHGTHTNMHPMSSFGAVSGSIDHPPAHEQAGHQHHLVQRVGVGLESGPE